ncbi:MAG: hypothetical protein ABEJ31_15355 [Haloarculaceae archaeon]
MERGSLAAIALATALVLAGCSWVAQPASQPTPRNDSNGSSVPKQLLSTHLHALANQSYAVRVRENTSTASGRRNLTYLARSNRTTERQLVRLNRAGRSKAQFLNRSVLVSRVVANGTLLLTTRPFTDGGEYAGNKSDHPVTATFDRFHRDGVAVRRLTAIYEVGAFERSGTVRRNGRTLTEYRLAHPSLNRKSNVSITHSSGRVLVDADGIVRLARIDLRGTQQDHPFVFEVEYRVTAVGTVTVSRPDWMAKAPSIGRGVTLPVDSNATRPVGNQSTTNSSG